MTATPSSHRAGWIAVAATICIWTGFILVSRAGGKGVYGPIPMPPSGPDKIADADLKAAIEFILKS